MKLPILLLTLIILLASPAYALAASLSLSPTSGTFNKGCPFNLEVKLDTSGAQTAGTDAIVIYDNTKLSATNVTTGSIYADYPGTSPDDATGKVTISGLASFSSSFSGTGTLATINFTVKDTAGTGATIVKFDYDPSGKSATAQCLSSGANTCDSNVVSKDNIADVLSSVVNGSYTIGTGACGAVGGTQPGVGVGQGAVGIGATNPLTQTPVKEAPPLKALPPAGSEQFTFMVAILGSALTILGILGLALL